MKNKYKIFIVLIFLFTPFLVHAAEFNPNYIISNDEILDSSAMSLVDIQNFLYAKNSFLANYSCADAKGTVRKTSEIIYNAAVNNLDCDDAVGLSDNPTDEEKALKCRRVTINPKFILVLLQKEQSLVENSNNPTQRQLDWALGYGCPDGSGCIERFRGLGKQINSASLQFFDYMVNPDNYTYQAGQTYTFTNPYSTTYKGTNVVTPANQATAGLYNYTPHVYNGNYNFWKIWQRWFAREFPDGSLLQVKGEAGVWLLQNGYKRAFLTRGALVSKYDINKIITVSKADLDKYQAGAPIKFPQYSIVQSPAGTIYLLVDDYKRSFANKEAFRKIGINPEELLSATDQDLSIYKNAPSITSTTTFATGALLQDKKTGGVFWVMDGKKAPIIDRIFLTTRFKNKSITPFDPVKLVKYETIGPALFNDGELLKSSKGLAVYVISNGQKRPFSSGEAFEKLGYKWKNIITVSDKILNLYPIGLPIILEQKIEDNPLSSTTPENLNSTSTFPNTASSTSSTTIPTESTRQGGQ
jgi:hypothetical protein